MGTTRHALSKSEKALVALAAISIALWLLETAVPFLLPLRQFSLALVLILGGLLAMRRLMGLGRYRQSRHLGDEHLRADGYRLPDCDGDLQGRRGGCRRR